MPRRHALLGPILAHAFDALRISASVWTPKSATLWSGHGGVPDQWYAIHTVRNIAAFEFEHGRESRRYRYNDRCFARVLRTRKPLRGTHAGFHDLFVPIGEGTDVTAVLVAGPFAVTRPTSSDVQERWHALTHSHGRVADPSFSEYLAQTLATITFEGPLLDTFERLMSYLARLLAGGDAPGLLLDDVGALRRRMDDARFAERMWDVAHQMVDERRTRIWATSTLSQSLSLLGIERLPEQVVVGLLLGRKDEIDPVDDIIRRDAFQRACVDLGRKLGDVASGRVGDHGVTFLMAPAPSVARTRAKLTALAERAGACARRFGLRLHVGIAEPTERSSLPVRYRGALWAAEKALSRGTAIVYAEPEPTPSAKRMRDLKNELARSVGQRSVLLSPRFDRYIETILVHCGYRLEPTRAQLESGLERLAEPFLATGALDEKSFDNLYAAMERAAEDAPTVTALVAHYRRLVADIESTLQNPRAAGQDRSMRRALEFIREHLGDALTLSQVARVAGFAPGYFSKLFKRQERTTFGRYLQKVRVARAQQMLTGTALSIERVGKLCGFPNRSYFYRVFKNRTGLTPLDQRERRSK